MDLIIIGILMGPGIYIGSMTLSQDKKERTVGALLTWALLIVGFVFGSMSIGAHEFHHTTAELLYGGAGIYAIVQWLISLLE